MTENQHLLSYLFTAITTNTENKIVQNIASMIFIFLIVFQLKDAKYVAHAPLFLSVAVVIIAELARKKRKVLS